MSIVYPLSFPATPGPAQATIEPNDTIGVSTSPYTGQQELVEHQGKFWTLKVAFPIMTRATAEPILAVLTALKGPLGTFYFGDPLATTPLGVATGTPLVSGTNNARAATLVTKGWTTGVTNILKAGDYLQVGAGLQQRLYKVLNSVNSDGSGNATFDIWPTLREALTDSMPITLSSTKGTFRLDSNKRSWVESVGGFYTVSFGGIEAQ